MRRNFQTWFDRAVPDGAGYFENMLEGPDDMPAHIKSTLTGHLARLPVSQGPPRPRHLEGIYLRQYPNYGGPRSVVVTAFGG